MLPPDGGDDALPSWFDDGDGIGDGAEPPSGDAGVPDGAEPDAADPDAGEPDAGEPGKGAAAQAPAVLTTLARQSQREIIGRQFRKHRSAVWGLHITRALVYLAVFAPVLAAGDPLLWRSADADGGSWSSPWFANLFDRNVYESVLDRLFNLIMLGMAAHLLFRLGMRVFAGAGWRRRPGPGRLGRVVRRTLLLAGLVMAVCMVLPRFDWPGNAIVQALDPTRSTTRIAYSDVAQRYEAAGEAAAAWATADEETRAAWRVEFPGLATEPDPERPGTFREREPDPDEWSFVRVPTPIPYGYREMLPAFKDRFLPAFDFSRGPHVLGTDESGRDVMAQVLYGTRIALTVGIVAVSIYVLIGTILGSLAGYFRGWVDMVIMRAVEMFISIPAMFLLLMIIAVTPVDYRTIFLIMAVIGLISWTGTTRLVRGEFLAERNKEYVAAAQMLGLGKTRIIFRHILPNALSPVIVTATFGVAGAILTESGLSFLGLGDINVPSWGKLLNAGRTNARWHLIIPPSVAIFITVTALNLIGDGLRDALDPKLRN
jgi:peptide/nickel transport system permease protein